MAKPRELKRRIRSVENTRQITKTMEMIAATKIKRAQERIEAARPYAERMRDILVNLVDYVAASEHPLLEARHPYRKTLLVVITSDRGLCGAFNSNIFRRAMALYRQEEEEGRQGKVLVVGKKGLAFFRHRRLPVVGQYVGIGDRPDFEHARAIAGDIIDLFLEKEIDKVHLVYNRFKSIMEHRAVEQIIFPIQEASEEFRPAEAKGQKGEYIFEPGPGGQELMSSLLPSYVQTLVFRALLESAASEHGARRTAMKAATDNAGEMIENLTRKFNRARQAQITQEIAEIVGGAEALKHAR